VWGIFSITGEKHPDADKNPYNTMVGINDQVSRRPVS
jgi:amidase